MSARGQVLLAARRELVERARSHAFLASTAVQLLIVVGIIVISALTGGEDTETYEVGAIGAEARSIVTEARQAQAGFGIKIEPEELSSEQEGVGLVEAGELDASVGPDSLVTGQDPPAALSASIQAATRTVRGSRLLAEQGLSPSEADQALDPPPLGSSQVGEGDTDQAVGFTASLLLYIAILSFGIVVATGVVEEKSSRVIEMVLSAVRASRLLAGKVLGIGLLGLGQLLVVAGIGYAVASLSGQVDLPSTTLSTLLLVIVYFLLGYALYACAFAVAGALVSRQEDVGGATTPLTVLLVAAYLVSIQTLEDAGSGLATATSIFPATAPIVAPTRIAQGAMPLGEILLSVALLAVSIVLMIGLATRVYEQTVLRVGSPIKLRRALALARGRSDRS